MDIKSSILKASPGNGQAAIFYLGQETILIKQQDLYLLFDPYLSGYVDQYFSTETVVWKRNYPEPIAPAELDFIDYVFCTHAHGDHADPLTLSAIAQASPAAVFIGSAPVLEVYAACGIDARRIMPAKADQMIQLDKGLMVMPIPAAHEELHPTADGSYEELSFITEIAGIRIYHAGDCCLYDGLIERLNGVDVACLPINGRDYFRRKNDIIGNFDAPEAIRLAHAAGISLLIPMHFDLYSVNCVNPAYFVDCQQKIAPAQRYHIFTVGEKYLFEK
ncbi:MAG: MBL fold metallo-hydrolase [Clostridiaceae bacterium]|nr:MBL fold metallo-hydrolase [Clostridiaceae bacterium]